MARSVAVAALGNKDKHGAAVSNAAPVGAAGFWNMVFEDTFSDTTVNSGLWRRNRSGGTALDAPFDLNAENAYYNPADVTEGSGNAVLTLANQPATVAGVAYTYGSGTLSTEGLFAFGDNSFIEARVSIPTGAGLWPEVGAAPVGQLPPEITLFEFVNTASTSRPSFNYQWRDTASGLVSASGPSVYGRADVDYRTGFHVYGLLRQGGFYTPYVDGVPWPSAAAASQDVLNLFVVLRLALLKGQTPTVPTSMLVDYVRAWSNIGVGASPLAAAGKVATFTDSFTSLASSAPEWDFPAGSALTAGQVVLTPTVAGTTFKSRRNWDLSSSSMYARVVQLPNALSGVTTFAMSAVRDSQNLAAIRWNNGTLSFVERAAGVETVTTTPYDSVAHAWWRLRHGVSQAGSALAAETWTGTAGNAWPVQWTPTGTVGSATITATGQGALTTPATVYTLAPSEYLSGMAATSDTEVTFDIGWDSTTAESYACVNVRSGGTMFGGSDVQTRDGYYVQFTVAQNTLEVGKTVAGVKTRFTTTAPYGFTDGVRVNVRFRLIGGDLSIRLWNVGTVEPTAWTYTVTDPSPYLTAGKVTLALCNGALGTARTATFDNLTVTNGTGTTASSSLFFDTSPDGGAWTTQRTLVTARNYAQVGVRFAASCSTTPGSDPGTAVVDNFNSVAILPPAAPTLGSVVMSGASNNRTATISYAAPTNTGGSALTQLTAEVSPATAGVFTLHPALGGTSTTITGLPDNTSFTYSLTASNSNGTSAPATVTFNTGAPVFVGITPVGTSTLIEGATVTSLAVPVPAGVVRGEVLVAQLGVTGTTITGPAGWTLINYQTFDVSVAAYYRVVTGTEPASYTWSGFTSGRASGSMQRFAGVDNVSPMDVTPVGVANSSLSTQVVVPSVTTITPNAMLLSGAVLNASSAAALIEPAGMTLVSEIAPNGGRVSSWAYENRPTPGATGTRTWVETPTTTTLQMAGWAAALRPAAGAATAPAAPFVGNVTQSGTTGSRQATVAYAAPTATGGSALTQLTATLTPSATFTLHPSLTGTQASLTGLADGTTYTYTLTASNSVGTSAPASVTFTTGTGSTSVPDAPTLGAVSQAGASGARTAAIPFQPPANTGGATITSFSATLTPSTGVTFAASPGPVTGGTANLSGLADSTTYVYTLAAVNSVGTGSAASVSFTTPASGGGGGTGIAITNRELGATTATTATVSVKTPGTVTGLRLKVGTDTAVTQNVVFSTSVTPDAQGYSKPTVTGLQAGTQYYGVFETNGLIDSTKPVQFRTIGATLTSLTFAHSSCLNYQVTSSVFNLIVARNPNYWINMGDRRYVDTTTNDPTLFRTSVYDQCRADSAFGNLMAKIPGAYVWSDHDWSVNDSDGSATSGPAAQSAFRQCMPHFPLGATDGKGIYQTWTAGTVGSGLSVRFILTDNRSYKSALSATDNSTKTILGTAQKTWFKNLITSAQEDLIIWGSENPWIEATTAGSDRWGGYNTERQELASHITASGKRVVIISGDMHAVGADSGVNSAGGIPVLHASPMHNDASFKGGPYSQGTYPGSGIIDQYGFTTITLSGTTLTLQFNGYDASNTPRISLTKTWTVSSSTTAPDAPNVTTATQSGASGARQAVIAYTAPTNTGGSALTQLTASITPSAGVTFTLHPSLTGTSTTVTGLADATTYTYSLTASNAVGTGPADSVQFTTPGAGGGTNPSGQAMPNADLPGWQVSFAEDFNTDLALGSWPGPYKFASYANAVDTSHNGTYNSQKVCSVAGGMLDKYLHTESGVHYVSALLPMVGGGNGYLGQTGGRYAMRFRVVNPTGNAGTYKVAWLLWPDSGVWPADGEIDYPECRLAGENITGASHYSNNGADAFTKFTSTSAPSSWHTCIIEWLPGVSVKFILDGATLGTATTSIPTKPMHWVIQSETQDSGAAPASADSAHIQIDWLVAWKKV